MSWTTDRIGLKDNQTKTRRIDLNKFTLGPVRGSKFQCILIGNSYKYDFACYSPFFSLFPISNLWRISYIIQLLFLYLDLTLVDHLSHYLSVCPIRHLLQFSVSCSSQGNTIQGFSPHKCGQKVSCSAFNVMTTAFPQIFPSFHSSGMFMMHVPLSETSQKVTLSNRIYI